MVLFVLGLANEGFLLSRIDQFVVGSWNSLKARGNTCRIGTAAKKIGLPVRNQGEPE
jgi:hypothetical protein